MCICGKSDFSEFYIKKLMQISIFDIENRLTSNANFNETYYIDMYTITKN